MCVHAYACVKTCPNGNIRTRRISLKDKWVDGQIGMRNENKKTKGALSTDYVILK